MPHIPIIMPQLGEAIAEATIIGFLAKAGDAVKADQDIVEVETNKATMNVSSPASGKVVEWSAKQDESYAVG
jgi:pyruvate/2-oxoglutarate dehydrogenase complex dihydrolipoamide acyltransferase (E2) component